MIARGTCNRVAALRQCYQEPFAEAANPSGLDRAWDFNTKLVAWQLCAEQHRDSLRARAPAILQGLGSRTG